MIGLFLQLLDLGDQFIYFVILKNFLAWKVHSQFTCTSVLCYFNVMIFQEKQGGQIGLVVDCEWAEPNSEKPEDKVAATGRLEFQLGW